MDSHSHSQPHSQSQGHIDIDALLERYLSLLDEYTALRETLSSLQRDMYQGLARANFSAERGIRRYGADHYDQRMQAVRKVEIASCSSSKDCPSERGAEEGDGHGGDGDGVGVGGFKISVPPVESEPEHEDTDGGDGEKVAGAGGEDGRESENTSTEELAGKEEKETKQGEKKKKKSNDPLRWFGLITPVPLRQAQANAVKVVEEIIPRLASVNMAMAEVELEVRRARKKRAKAAAAAEKAGRAGKAEVEPEPGAGEEVQAAA